MFQHDIGLMVERSIDEGYKPTTRGAPPSGYEPNCPTMLHAPSFHRPVRTFVAGEYFLLGPPNSPNICNMYEDHTVKHHVKGCLEGESSLFT